MYLLHFLLAYILFTIFSSQEGHSYICFSANGCPNETCSPTFCGKNQVLRIPYCACCPICVTLLPKGSACYAPYYVIGSIEINTTTEPPLLFETFLPIGPIWPPPLPDGECGCGLHCFNGTCQLSEDSSCLCYNNPSVT